MLSLVIWVIFAALTNHFGWGKDDSDGPNSRSGLTIRRDALTGCEYLETRKGHLMPRLDAEGDQICRLAR